MKQIITVKEVDVCPTIGLIDLINGLKTDNIQNFRKGDLLNCDDGEWDTMTFEILDIKDDPNAEHHKIEIII